MAYISHERLSQAKSKSYLDVAPELIVEVLSPHDTWSAVNSKLAEYFEIDVKLVWIVDPVKKQVHVYQSLTTIEILAEDDTLTGGNVLPEFSVKVAEIFEM